MSVAAMLYLGGSADGVAGFDRSSKIDAVARVGGLYRLVGATTRATIALLLCESVSPPVYRSLGDIWWFNADGVEFDGEFSVVDQGVATHDWGVAGSKATGGLINNGNGAQFITGLQYLRGNQRFVGADVNLVSLNNAIANGAWIGTTRFYGLGAFSGAGLGVNALGQYACAAFVAKDLEDPVLTTNIAFVGAPATGVEQQMWAESDTGAAATTQITRGGIHQRFGQAQLGATATLNDEADTDDRIPCISGRGIVCRHTTMSLTGWSESGPP